MSKYVFVHHGYEEPTGPEAATGYTVVEAAGMVAAEKLLESCPIITSVRVYEAMPMNG